MKLAETIKETELLYRVVKRSKPGWLDYGKPTSAMFRDDNVVSVDRDGGRTEIAVINAQKESFGNRLKGVVRILAGKCFDVGANVEAAPSAENIYHANIRLDVEDRKREMLQAYKIAQSAVIVYLDDSVAWV